MKRSQSKTGPESEEAFEEWVKNLKNGYIYVLLSNERKRWERKLDVLTTKSLYKMNENFKENIDDMFADLVIIFSDKVSSNTRQLFKNKVIEYECYQRFEDMKRNPKPSAITRGIWM